jgi:S-formylglutathione hydrolase FrmB
MTNPLGHWTEETIGGHPCDVYQPPEAAAMGYVVLYLHGVHLGKLADQAAFVQQLSHHGLGLVAPVTQRSWWTDKICAEFDEAISAEQHVLRNIVPYIARRWDIAPPRIGLLGTSMGGQGALRLAYKYPDTFPVVAAISPAIDYQIRFKEGDANLRRMYRDAEAVRQDTAILHIHPLNWPRHQFFCCDPTDQRWHESAQRLRMKLSSLGIPHECDLETSGGGHGFEYYNLMAEKAIGFVVAGLQREVSRIV